MRYRMKDTHLIDKLSTFLGIRNMNFIGITVFLWEYYDQKGFNLL